MADTGISIKLIIDKRKQRVLFAEGGKDFADFLFTILTLPIGAVIKLLAKSAMGDSLINLYQSLEDLDPTYMRQSQEKATLLYIKPILSSNVFYNCSVCRKPIPNLPNSLYCETCLTRTRIYIASAAGYIKLYGRDVSEGYVKDKVTYMIMDDLVMKPISAVVLLNRVNSAELGCLEEKVVNVGIKEGLDLLKASLQSTTVLTDVFLVQERDLSSNEV